MCDVCSAFSVFAIIPIKDESIQFLGGNFFTGLKKQLQEF